jgi:hypothetical protein
LTGDQRAAAALSRLGWEWLPSPWSPLAWRSRRSSSAFMALTGTPPALCFFNASEPGLAEALPREDLAEPL